MSEEEERVWNALVEEGRSLRAPKLAEKEAKVEANAVATDGHVHAKKPHSEWKTRKHRVSALAEVFEVPVGVKRFMVLRAAGLSFHKAVNASGTKWCDVSMAKGRSEEARCACEAMEKWSRDLMRTRSYATMEDAVSGEPVSKVMADASKWILERTERERFADPKARTLSTAPRPVRWEA